MSRRNYAKTFIAGIIPSVTYGVQTWSLTEKKAEKLRFAERPLGISMMRIKKRNKKFYYKARERRQRR